jgi:uncharacterized protein YraI
MGLQYLDFDLQIEEGTSHEYQVQVLRSPAGEAQEVMRLPYDELALENRLLTLQNALLRSGGQRRSVPASEQLAVRDFGQALFDALMTGEVRSRYDVSLERARQAQKGLRLRLRFQSPSLAALPWEFMYDSREGEFVCLTTNTPLVRYLDSPRPPKPISVVAPLRVLGVAASPSDLQALNVDNEKQRIDAGLKGLQQAGRLEITWLAEPSWQGIQRALRQKQWHIVHFIGHGSFDPIDGEGQVYLVNEDGKAQPFGATEFGRLLADHASIRLVVLNACESAKGNDRDIFSSTASILVRRGMPAVLAMQYEITDQAAIVLARAFYEALADNMPVDAAVAEARKAVSFAVNNTVEWGTPVLTMRATDGVLFEVIKQEIAAPAQAAVPTAVEPAEPAAEPVLAVTRSETQAAAPAAVVPMEQRPQPAAQPSPALAAGAAQPAASARKRRWAVPVAMLAILLLLSCVIIFALVPDQSLPQAGEPLTTAGAATLAAVPQAGAVAALLSSGTAAPAAPAPAVADDATATPSPTNTTTPTAPVIAAPTATDDATPTLLLADTATPSPPTPAPTQTPAPALAPVAPVAVASGQTNLRAGPGTDYPVVNSLAAGGSVAITGKNQAGTWWQVEDPNGQTAWIIASRVDAAGAVDNVAVVAAPPAPTFAPTAAPARSGLVADFENTSPWPVGDQRYGRLEPSREQVQVGSVAARLSYDFPAVANNFVVFRAPTPLAIGGLSPQPSGLSLWVYGDRSGHYLNAWVQDAAGEVRAYTFGQILHSGWQQMTARFDDSRGWPNGTISGPDNGRLDFPVRLAALVLDGVPDGAASSGVIYLDEMTVLAE